MLFLRTGLPGASKTLNTLKEICEDKSTADRDIYYNNIKLLLLDIDVVQSFQGFFYGYVLPNLSDKDRQKYNKILLRVHGQGEFISENDVPHLRVHYENWLNGREDLNLFVEWCRRVYPKSKLEPLEDYLKIADSPTLDEVRQFKLDWKNFPDPTQWPHLPPHSIIVVDECQRWFPPRAVGAKVPYHVSQFETHRHKGLDIHLVTQDAKLLDSHVRRLVGRHIHFQNPLASKRITRMENDKAFDPSDFHQRKNASKSVKKRDKNFYGLYWSADVHTHKRRFPKILLLLIPIVGLFGYTVFYISTLDQRFGAEKPVNEVPAAGASTPGSSRVTSDSPVVGPGVSDSSRSEPAFNHFDEIINAGTPLSAFCDRVTYAGNETIKNGGTTYRRYYLQCVKEVVSSGDSTRSDDDDEKASVETEGYLLDRDFLESLGFSFTVVSGMPVLKYGNEVFVFPKI